MSSERLPNVVVAFNSKWSVFNRGERAGVAPAMASQLVAAGIARIIEPPKPPVDASASKAKP